MLAVFLGYSRERVGHFSNNTCTVILNIKTSSLIGRDLLEGRVAILRNSHYLRQRTKLLVLLKR